MTPSPDPEPTLSVQQAFVVQFRSHVNIDKGEFEGRVEHVATGETEHFHSRKQLFDFMVRLLTAATLQCKGKSQKASV